MAPAPASRPAAFSEAAAPRKNWEAECDGYDLHSAGAGRLDTSAGGLAGAGAEGLGPLPEGLTPVDQTPVAPAAPEEVGHSVETMAVESSVTVAPEAELVQTGEETAELMGLTAGADEDSATQTDEEAGAEVQVEGAAVVVGTTTDELTDATQVEEEATQVEDAVWVSSSQVVSMGVAVVVGTQVLDSVVVTGTEDMRAGQSVTVAAQAGDGVDGGHVDGDGVGGQGKGTCEEGGGGELVLHFERRYVRD
ncbi:hypothetical protein MRB53_041021 [Persea americana]|nr:hypothetical protein MRB53_041021 [Persea americana]